MSDHDPALPVAATSSADAPMLPRRRVEKRRGRAGLWPALLVLFIPHVWIGLGLIVAAIAQLAFPLLAEPVPGHVVDKRLSHGKGNTTHHRIVVGYRLGGTDTQTELKVDEAAWNAAKTGDEVPLRAARLFGFDQAHRADAMAVPALLPVALFWNAICAVFVWALALRPILRWWLVRRGKRARGIVDAIEKLKGSQRRVRYHFKPAGETGGVEATMDVGAKELGALPKEVTVFHHPRRPRFAVIYELSAWQIVDDDSA